MYRGAGDSRAIRVDADSLARVRRSRDVSAIDGHAGSIEPVEATVENVAAHILTAQRDGLSKRGSATTAPCPPLASRMLSLCGLNEGGY